MENPNHPSDKQKVVVTPSGTQALQVVTGMPPTPVLAGSTPVTLPQAPPPPRVAEPVADPPRRSTSSDTSMEEISPALLGAIQQIVSVAIREQTPQRRRKKRAPLPRASSGRKAGSPSTNASRGSSTVARPLRAPSEGSTRCEVSNRGSPEDERQGVPFTETVMADELPMNCRTPAIAEAAQQWFNQLPEGSIGSFQEFRSLFLYQFSSSQKLRKTELILFAIWQKDNEPLKEYLQRFNAAALEVPSATQKVKASAFSQGLLDGDFFKSLAKKSVSKFDALLARAAKYINMEDAQAAKKESRGEKRKETKEETPSKKPRVDTRDRQSPFQRVNIVYTPLTVPITQALMAVEGKGLLTRPRSWKDTPQRPKTDKFYHFYNDYGHTTEECRHLKNEIERLIQNGYLQEYVTEAHDVFLKEVLDVEAMEDAPLIQFGRAERSGPRTSHNDALVITALLANYELGDVSLENVNTSLYGFAGEVVYPQGMVSLPLTMGAGVTRKTCMLKFLVVDVPSAYNIILGRPTLNAFQAVVSTYNMKIKFPTPGGVGEVQGDPLQSRKCYVEAVRRGQKRTSDESHKGVHPSKKGKDTCGEEALEETGAPAKVPPAEELLNIEIIPGHLDKTTRIGSQMSKETKKEVVLCLQRNADIFAWTPQDLEGIDSKVIIHYLNIDPSIKPVKQEKRHFGPKNDKIIQAEVDKLMAAGQIEEIQFPKWLSNVVLVPKPGGKWRMCIDFRDLHKARPEDFYPLLRIDQLVDSTSCCELLSMMDASQGYHQIMLAPEDRKKVSFITSTGTFCYVAMPFGLKNAGATYQRLVDKIFRP
ncbi:UNVERIFIED_CONTAM: Pro-Pol polyprotein [Sesamum latifolium]|uniref:Pro-Pol polyprotein n=1 Tax=Sesamum latifolium TaxID=2727402 RepID=A0AAW2TD81_9LAMI